MKTKRLILIVLVTSLQTLTFGQKIGVGIAYAKCNALNGEFLYRKENNIFKLGASIQSSDRRGKEVENQLANYGQTTDGTGEYFLTVV